ncbi:hypothetical protein JCM18899A_44580 [Nocardioides sp. AN3]
MAPNATKTKSDAVMPETIATALAATVHTIDHTETRRPDWRLLTVEEAWGTGDLPPTRLPGTPASDPLGRKA